MNLLMYLMVLIFASAEDLVGRLRPRRRKTHHRVPQVGSACYNRGSSKDARDAFCGAGLFCARQGHDGRNWGGCKTNPGLATNKIGLPGPPYDHHCCSSAAYVALDNGPGCSANNDITTAAACQRAANSLGYTGTVVNVNVNHAPKGCHVAQPANNWAETYFNSKAGKTGRAVYRSICRQDIAAYVALDNGPGCSANNDITTAAACQRAANSLGYTGTVLNVNVNHAPKGCHVGHPADNWAKTYFNSNAGKTGRAVYRSICRQEIATQAVYCPKKTYLKESQITVTCQATSGSKKVDLKEKRNKFIVEIPEGSKNVQIKLDSEKDLDLCMFDETYSKCQHQNHNCVAGYGCKIIGEHGGDKSYAGMNIHFSGDDRREPVMEEIKIIGKTAKKMFLDVISYEDSLGTVTYKWDAADNCGQKAQTRRRAGSKSCLPCNSYSCPKGKVPECDGSAIVKCTRGRRRNGY